MTDVSDRVAVIGGGVSGMAAAHYLSQAGCAVDLYEASDQLGGRVGVGQFNQEEVCFGGKNIGFEYSEFRDFLARYGDPDYDYFGINSARLERGAVQAFNSQNKLKSLQTIASAATSRDMWRLLKAAKAVKAERQNGDTAGLYFKGLKAVTLTDYFSPRFVEKIIRPLTVRMNGAEPTHISLENFGTHLQMLLDEYEQLNTPLSEVFSSFKKAENINIKLNQQVISIKTVNYNFIVVSNNQAETYKNLIVALPALVAAPLIRAINPTVQDALKRVRYFPVGVVLAEYEQDVFGADIRALVLGPDSPISNIGAYSATQLNRVRYTFSGEMAAEILHENLEEADLLALAEETTAPYFNINGNKCTNFALRYWPQGLCGYTEHEFSFQTDLSKALEATPNLYLTGDYRKGASIENCFRASKACVEALLETQSTNITPYQTAS